MLIPVLVIGGAGTLIAIAALMSKQKATQPPLKRDPIDGGDDDDKPGRDDPPDDEGGGRGQFDDLGKQAKKIIGTWLEKTDPKPTPDPVPTPAPPSPFEPSPAPVPGKWYQVIQGDTLWEIARAAYGVGTHYPRIVEADQNQWIGKYGHSWGGGLYPKYSGWNTGWKSGYEWPVVYIPVLP